MSTNRRAPLAIPILIIVVGVGWLLTVQRFGPGINWIWTLSLACVGILTFVLGGFNKATIVVGPFFLLASLFSVLRQVDQLDLDSEIPVLVICLGILLLVAQIPAVPNPDWYVAAPEKQASEPPSDPKHLRL
jgi:hypothetical protein